MDFIRESGRMVVLPVWSDTFSRNDGSAFHRYMSGGAEQRELGSAWAADLGLAIDYLGTRDDVNADAIAFVITSYSIHYTKLYENQYIQRRWYWGVLHWPVDHHRSL